MALQADIVAVGPTPKTVWFVAVAARHSRLKRSALDEGAVLIDFALNLAVRKIEVSVKQCNSIVVADGLAVDVVFVNLTAPRMAACAHLDFVLRNARCASAGIARGRG